MPRGNRPPYPYDCILDGVGLMLSSGSGGEVAWRERKLDFFAPRVSQTDQSYAQFPPEDETTWAVDDLSGGFGQRVAAAGRVEEVLTRPGRHTHSEPGHSAARGADDPYCIVESDYGSLRPRGRHVRIGRVGRLRLTGRPDVDAVQSVRSRCAGNFGRCVQGSRGPDDGVCRGRRIGGRRTVLDIRRHDVDTTRGPARQSRSCAANRRRRSDLCRSHGSCQRPGFRDLRAPGFAGRRGRWRVAAGGRPRPIRIGGRDHERRRKRQRGGPGGGVLGRWGLDDRSRAERRHGPGRHDAGPRWRGEV